MREIIACTESSPALLHPIRVGFATRCHVSPGNVAAEVLHVQRTRQLLLQRIVDVAAGLLLEDRTEDVEVPVRVELIRAVLLRAARRRLRQEVARIRRHVVDARSGA